MNNSKNYESLLDFKISLLCEERSSSTVSKYLHDVRTFFDFAGDKALDKSLVLEYKSSLLDYYAVSSANSMLAALNAYFRFIGRLELCVKRFKIQRPAFCSEEKELTKAEYFRLVKEAERRRDYRLSLIIQTICGTGIRVSELKFITVEAVWKGEATVNCKGKTRRIFIISALRKKLSEYIKRRGIKTGSVFLTRSGAPITRHNVWRDMKALCGSAGVPEAKVFPHNLRHLFARSFYTLEKDVVKLADILGHASINTTRIYTVTTGAEHKRRMESMRLII